MDGWVWLDKGKAFSHTHIGRHTRRLACIQHIEFQVKLFAGTILFQLLQKRLKVAKAAYGFYYEKSACLQIGDSVNIKTHENWEMSSFSFLYPRPTLAISQQIGSWQFGEVEYFRELIFVNKQSSAECHAWFIYSKHPERALVSIQSVFWGFIFPRVSYTKRFQMFSSTFFSFFLQQK